MQRFMSAPKSKMNTNSNRFRTVLVVLVIGLASSVGCTTWKPPKMFSLDNTWPFKDKNAPHEGIPVRIVGTWTDTVMTQPGQKPQRGFGGRLMFYEKDGKNPILVDGQLIVYAFTETNREPTDNKPTRRYVFPQDQMPLHMSKSDLGASYSFWLPWDEVGGSKTEVSLICRFEPKTGGVVTSEQTHHILPGPDPPKVAKSDKGDQKPPRIPDGVPCSPAKQTLEDMQSRQNAARQASYETPAGANAANANVAPADPSTAGRHLTATTITLPQNFQLPDAATLAAMQQAAYASAAQQNPQTINSNAALLQLQAAQARAYAQPTVPAMQQAAFVPAGIGMPLQQSRAVNAPANVFPTGPANLVGQPNWSTMAMGQGVTNQFATPAGQQPIMQTPAPQPALVQQQPMVQPPVGSVPNWPPVQPQMPATATQPTGTTQTGVPQMATVTYPYAGQLPAR